MEKCIFNDEQRMSLNMLTEAGVGGEQRDKSTLFTAWIGRNIKAQRLEGGKGIFLCLQEQVPGHLRKFTHNVDNKTLKILIW